MLTTTPNFGYRFGDFHEKTTVNFPEREPVVEAFRKESLCL
jgi:hypothetical protein